MLNIVLYQPEIPQNTGNIARTCAITDTKLHLIKPLGFSLSEKAVKRAGLDYWPLLNLTVYDNFDDFLCQNKNANIFLLSTHAKRLYNQTRFPDNAFLLFGKETAGVPDFIHDKYCNTRFRIPMKIHPDARSLNLSNAVSIVLYEALRQNDFFDLK